MDGVPTVQVREAAMGKKEGPRPHPRSSVLLEKLVWEAVGAGIPRREQSVQRPAVLQWRSSVGGNVVTVRVLSVF